MPGGLIALERPAKLFVSLTVPDGLNWFLEDVPQHAFLPVLPGAFMAERGKTTGEHIAARGNVGQRVGAPAPRPWPLTKIPHEALYGCGGAGRSEGDATL